LTLQQATVRSEKDMVNFSEAHDLYRQESGAKGAASGDHSDLAGFLQTDAYPTGKRASIGNAFEKTNWTIDAAHPRLSSMSQLELIEGQAAPESPNERTAAQYVANRLLDYGRLVHSSQTGLAMFEDLTVKYEESGVKGMQTFLDEVNKEMGGEFILSMHEDPDELKKIQERAAQNRIKPPDFLRRIHMEDSHGKDRGDMNFLYDHTGTEEGEPI